MAATTVEWRSRYKRTLAVTDAIVVLWATCGAYLIRFQLDVSESVPGETTTYATVTLFLALIWWALLGTLGTREPKILGAGSEEYKRILNSDRKSVV